MEIVCNDDNFTPEQIVIIPNRPKRNNRYSIRELVESSKGTGILLNEIHNPHNGNTARNGITFTFEPNFAIRRFSDLQGNPLTRELIKENLKRSKKIVESIELQETD